MMGLFFCGIGLAGAWGLGLALADCILQKRSRPQAPNASLLVFSRLSPEMAGLGLVLGIGGTSWALFVWSLLGGRLGFMTSLSIAMIGLALGAMVIVRLPTSGSRGHLKSSNINSASNRSGALPFATSQQPTAVPGYALASTCQLVVIGLFLGGLIQALATPQRFWDERATFGLRSAVLAEDQTVWSKDLLHPDYVLYHPRYPLLISLAQQHVYALLGETNDRWAKCLVPLMYLGMVLVFPGVLLHSRPPSVAWLWATVLATVPALMPHDYGFLCSQADAPVACYHGLSILYLWEGLRLLPAGMLDVNRSRPTSLSPFVMAGTLAGLAAFTKDEGLAFAVIDTTMLTISGGLLALQERRSEKAADWTNGPKAALVFCTALIVVIGPWLVYRRYLPMTTEMNYVGRLSFSSLSARLSEVDWFAQHLLQRMFWEVAEWGATWWLVALAATLAIRKLWTRQQLLLLGDLAGAIAALLAAGLISPTPLVEHIGGSSQRFLMQLMPVGILFVAGQLTRDLQTDRRGLDDPNDPLTEPPLDRNPS